MAVLLPLLLVWAFLLRAWVATPELTSRRFPDESYGRDNLRALLLHGQIRPDNTFYPSLSYLPQAALLAASEGLHRATGAKAFGVFGARGSLSATGYLLCRLLQAVFGTLSLYLTFRIGRRLFSPGVGLGGALLLSVVEWHIRQSAIFKPDILLILTCLLAFLWSLDAAERQELRRYLLAGAGIGLALASKYNAAPMALPLCVAALAGGSWRNWRRWAWLALAGVTAASVFVLLNPFVVVDPGFYVNDFQGTIRHYQDMGVVNQGSHATLPLHALQTLLSASYHGLVVGALGLAGAVGLVIATVRRPRSSEPGSALQRLGRGMALTYVAGYTLLYSLATTYPSPHNWLPLTPFIALFAAWTVFRVWEWLAAHWPVLARSDVKSLAAAAMIVPLVLSAQRIAYSHVVRDTWTAAKDYLAGNLEPAADRLFYYEQGEARLVLRYGQNKAMAVGVERLDQVPPSTLDRADAELFPSDRRAGKEGDFYRRRVAALAPQQVVHIPAELFRHRGPALDLLVHPWRSAGDPLPVTLEHQGAAPRRLTGHLPPLAPDELGSLQVVLPEKWRWRALRSVSLGDQELSLANLGRAPEAVATERFDAAAARAPLLLTLRYPISPAAGEIQVWLRRWQR